VGRGYSLGFRYCPYCAKYYKTLSVFCPECNRRLRFAPRKKKLRQYVKLEEEMIEEGVVVVDEG